MAGFASITDVNIASAAVFTKVAVPEMIRFGYHPGLAVGIVAGSSVLGMLISHSILLIVYAFIVQVSVGSLFVAAIIPGLILGLFYSIFILAIGKLRPDRVGQCHIVEDPDDTDITPKSAVKFLAPVVGLVVLVIGGIYAGVFPLTESGAVGAAGALICVYIVIVIILGTLLDSVSIILIVLPIFIPLLEFFQLDLMWFGVLSIIVVEIGLFTP